MAKEATNKIGDHQLVSTFKGASARKDKTVVGPEYMVSPSKNVMIGTSGRPAIVAGYTLDGAGSTVQDSGIRSKFDFDNFRGIRRNMRVGFMTSAANDGKLQFRYSYNGVVSWLDLMTGLTSIDLCFTVFSDITEKIKEVLWVDGSSSVREWNGALATFGSAAVSNTIVKQGIIDAKTTIGFNSVGLKITDSANGFLNAGFSAGDTITVTGSVSNNLTYEILSVTAGEIAVKTGGVITTEAAGATITIKKKGYTTWAEDGFYTTRDKKIKINNIEYTYTGGEATSTLTGVTPDPAVASIPVGTPIYQSVVTTLVSAMSGIESTFKPTVIGNGKDNQIYLGMDSSLNQDISKVNNYKDYGFTSPTRVAGEGMLLRLKAPPVKYVPQEVQSTTDAYDMYISSGKNNWQVVRSTLSSDNTKEKLELIDLKIASLQGAMSEKLVTKMKNHIVFIGNDKVANFLGYMSFQYVPVMNDFSYNIIDDMKSYDFTDASIYYHRNYIYLALPKEGLIRIYNMTDQTQQQHRYEVEGTDDQPWFWEVPIMYPVSSFYEVDGELYGHSYTTSESYKLFSGGSFNGQNIEMNMTFGYDDKGERTQTKASDEIWVEGYIKQNTTANITVSGDLDYFYQSKTVSIDGSDSKLVAFGGKSGGIGKDPIGSKPLGSAMTSDKTLPAWFHGVKTYKQVPFYLEQVSITLSGIDQGFELLCFGTNSKMTSEGNNWITQ